MKKTTNLFGKTCIALAIGALAPLGAHAAVDKEPLRIGAVSSVSGVFAQQGEEVLRGIQFAVDEANRKGGVDGRQVAVQVADDESTPEAGRRVAEKLARDGNNLLIGAIPTSISQAISQNLERWNALYVVVASKGDKLTGEACKPRMFRTNHSDAMDMAMFTEWMKGVKEKNFAVIAADYAWGRDSAEFFGKQAKSLGKGVAVSLFPPLGTKDFAPYIAQIKDAPNVDGIWVALVGRDLIAFTKQAKEFGLTSKRIIGHAAIMDFVVKATGDATKGVWGNIGYGAEIDTPANQAFVAAWKAKYKRVPTENEGQAYNGTQAIFEGVRKAGSVKPADVAVALRGLSYDSVYGKVSMRADDNQLVLPNYIGQVKVVDGQQRPVIEKRYEAALVPAPSGSCRLK